MKKKKKTIYKVTLRRTVRQDAVVFVEADDSIDPDMVDEKLLADAVYEAGVGELYASWLNDRAFTPEQGVCTAERYTSKKHIDVTATVRDTDCYLEVVFKTLAPALA